MTTTPDALTPVSEAAISSSATPPADPTHRARFGMDPRTILGRLVATLARWRTAARHLAGALLDRFAAACRELTGEITFKPSIAVHRHGYLGRDSTCRVCRLDIHDFGEMCPEQRAADCSGCGQTVLLDYYLNHRCPTGRPTHRISNIRKTTPAQWRAILREQRIRERIRKVKVHPKT
jgi:hypothetical protein